MPSLSWRRALLCATLVVTGLAASSLVQATEIGHTPGSFEVSSDGDAQYYIALTLPPGLAGLQPNLGLSYSSRRDNGLLGVGWAVSGLSVIDRCRKNLESDGEVAGVTITSADLFCLDGNKLEHINGTYGASGATYQTELETYARITSNGAAGNGPAWFRVEGKDGLFYEYGNSTDSRIEALGSANVRAWALSKIADRSGNFIRFYYTEDTTNGAYRPNKVEYTGSAGAGPTHRVQFVYQTRPATDVVSGYLAGFKIKEINRLLRIEVRYISPSELIREYRLAYHGNSGFATQRSRLASVTECHATDCFPATTIAWQVGASGWNATAVSSGVTLTATQSVWAHPIDANGDGRDDLVYPTTGTNGKWRIMLANESGGYAAPIVTTYNDINFTQALPIDANGDGKEDLIVPGTDGKWWLMRHTSGTNFSFSSTGAPATGAGGKAWVADVDGDRLDDLLWITGTNRIDLRRNTTTGGAVSFAASSTTAWLADIYQEVLTPTPFGSVERLYRSGAQRKDFNSDGRNDLLVYMRRDQCMGEPGCGPAWTYYWQVLASVGTTFTALDKVSTSPMSPPPLVLVIDVNGDSRSDIVLGQTLRLSTGWAAGAASTLGPAINFGTAIGSSTLVTDWDGDGYGDLLMPVSNIWHYWRSTGEGFEPAVSTGLAANGTTLYPKVADVDGDGLPEIGFVDAPATSGVWKFYRHKGPYPDLLATATDGFGTLADFDYKAITDNSVYTPQTNAAVPTVRDYEGSPHVVSQATASNGVGGTFNMTYTYEGAKVSGRGRGFLGFNKRTVIDSRNGLRTVDTYLQAFPWIGALANRITYQSATSSNKVIDLANTWSAKTYSAGTLVRYYPFVSNSVRMQFEVGGPLDGAEVTRTTTTFVLDSLGTPVDVTETTLEVGGNTLTRRTYVPDVLNSNINWCMSRPQRTEVTHTTPSGSATRIFATNWDAVKCRADSEVVQPDDVAPLKATTSYGYDSFGNRSTITVTGAGMSARTTTINYGTTGRFPETITNPVGHVQLFQWDAKLGVPRLRTDPNSLVTNWVYDDFGRILREERPDATATEWVFGSCASGCVANSAFQVTTTHKTWPGAVVSGQLVTEYDAFGRERRTRSTMLGGALSYATTEYDNLGRLKRFDAPRWSGGTVFWTTYTYDLLNRVTKEERPVNDSSASVLQSTTWAYEGLESRETDPQAKVTTRIVDGWGRVIQMIDAASGSTEYEYGPFSNLTRTTDPAGNQIVLGYDIRGRKTSSLDPDMGPWAYGYNSLGELTSQTDAKAQQVTFEYDALSRLKKRIESEGTTEWKWDEPGKPKGRIGSITHPESYSETYSYDSFARPSQISTVADGTTYLLGFTYDLWGRLETVKYPASHPGTYRFQARYVYDGPSGLLSQVVDHAAPTTVFWQVNATNARGQVLDETLGNGLGTIRTFDEVTGWLDTINTGSATVQNLSYVWDKVGNLKERHDLRQTKTEIFSYDNLYRLTSASGGDSMTVTYDSAGIGNIASKTGIGTYNYTTPQTGCSYYTHSQPHAVRNAGGKVYCYDANGNMTKRDGSTLTWMSYNLPKKIPAGGDSAEFRYGPARARYKQISIAGGVTETTYYIGGLYERLTRPASLTEHKHYVLAEGQAVAIVNRRSSGVHETIYLHHDHLGSVDTITTQSAAVRLRLSYDAFGKRRDDDWAGPPDPPEWTEIGNTTRRGFTFHEHLDSVALIHMNGRVYDPALARFISADPLVPAPLHSQSFNRYSYTYNNPLSFTDPSGYDPREAIKLDNGAGGSRSTTEVLDFRREPSGGEGGFGGSWGLGLTEHGIVAAEAELEARVTGLNGSDGSSGPSPTRPAGGLSDPDFSPAGGAGSTDSAAVATLALPRFVTGSFRLIALGTAELTAIISAPLLLLIPDSNPGGASSALYTPEELQALMAGSDKSSGGFNIGGATTPGDPSQFDPDKQAPLQVVHAPSEIRNSSSYRYWSQQGTDGILRSLRPGQSESLRVAPDGRIFNGNTRITILQERGIDVNALPRELYTPLTPGL